MRYRIKSRLADLGKRQLDLLTELRKIGYVVNTPSELSGYISGSRLTPKAETVLAACDEIIKNWEKGR